jgi:hypothetical protein
MCTPTKKVVIMKKIIVLGPALPKWTEVEAIKKSLSFLEAEYFLHFLDPLVDAIENPHKVTDYALWENRIKNQLHDCVAFIAFSFGGIILRQCFKLFNKLRKKIIFISVPEKIDLSLRDQLTKIIEYADKEEVDLAMQEHSKSVFFPSTPLVGKADLRDKTLICKRLSIGLKAVLDEKNYNQENLINNSIPYTTIVGDKSTLVNINHIESSMVRRCIVVPNAGMRVLQDNPTFCQSVIKAELNEIK